MYHVISPDEHQKKLESQGLSPEIALDYTEQLLMFEKFGNVCDAAGIIQAKEVHKAFLIELINTPELIDTTQISGLRLQSWAEFLEENDILANMKAV